MKLPEKQSWRRLQARLEPGFKRMLLLSVAIHLLLPALYAGLHYFSPPRQKPPVYRVNLVNKPVKNPQAGRPEAGPEKKKTVEKAKPKPVVKPKPAPKPKPKPDVKKVVKPAPKPEPTPVAKPKPAPKPTISKAAEQSFQQKIEAMRRDKERDDRLAALRENLAREREKIDAPVGEVTGKGDQAGVDEANYVKAFITEQWRYSPYLGNNWNLEAQWLLTYSAEGTLLTYKAISSSGNKAFDDSLLRAILKSKELGQKLEKRTEFEVTFNLRDMQN
jgi:outer membrane biosynthesis protein TonB